MGDRKAREAGFTLVEVSIILLVLVILAAILLPNLGSFNRLARFARVREDVGALCSALSRYVVDTGEASFYEWGGRDAGGYESDTPYREYVVGLLVGDGDTPTVNGSASADGEAWATEVRDNLRAALDVSGDRIQFRVDTFANHLIHNTPLGYSSNGYRTPNDMVSGGTSAGIEGGLLFDSPDGQGFNSMFAWRGPYISDVVEPDPWGNRYMANVFALHAPQGRDGDGFTSAVLCYSAGPDEEADTSFNQPGGWSTGDDDVTAVLNASGGR